MITIETIITSRKQYVIDHVMPSDLDSDIKEGLKKKEELIKSIDGDYIRKIYPNIDEIIVEINESGISEENYLKFISGESLPVLNEDPEVAEISIQYCIDNDTLKSYTPNSIIEIDGLTRTINDEEDENEVEPVNVQSIGLNTIEEKLVLKSIDSDVVTLTYDANGGIIQVSGEEKATIEVDRDSGQYEEPLATKEGCIFKNWVVIKDGVKVPIHYGDPILFKIDHTIYAVWGTEITYDANGGTFDDGTTEKIQVVEDFDEATYEIPTNTITYPLVTDPITQTQMQKAQFKDWAVTKGEDTVTVETGNRLVIKGKHTVVARHNDLCLVCGAYKPCACDEEEPDTTCPECLLDPCICNDENHRRLYFLFTLTGSGIDTYWSRNVYWSILPKDVEKPNVCKFVRLNHLTDVLDKSDLLTKDLVNLINTINFGTTYNSLEELLLYLLDMDYSYVTLELLSKLASYDYILLQREELQTFGKLELKGGCFCKVVGEAKNYVYYGGSWIRLPVGLADLGESDTGKFLGTPYIHFSGAQVPEVVNEKTEEMEDGGGLYCLTSMLASNVYDNNEINSFIYIKVNPTLQQARSKKNCDKPPSCIKDDEPDEDGGSTQNGQLCEDNGVDKTSINGLPAFNTQSFETVLKDTLQKNLEPIWKGLGELKLGFGAMLKCVLNLGIGITIQGFFDVLANITAIIRLLIEIQAAMVSKLTASVAFKIKIDIGFRLLAKITGKLKASLELIKQQIECFMDSMLPQLHIEFETEINLSIDNVLTMGDIVQSTFDAELDTGIIGKKFSVAAVANMGMFGTVSADAIARAANNGSYAHDVVTDLVKGGVLALTDSGTYIRGAKMLSSTAILESGFNKVKAYLSANGEAGVDVNTSMEELKKLKITSSKFLKPKMLQDSPWGEESESSTILPMAGEYYAMSLAFADEMNKKALEKSSKILRDFAAKVRATSFVVNNNIDSVEKWRAQCVAELQGAAELATGAGVQLSGDLELGFGYSSELTVDSMLNAQTGKLTTTASTAQATWGEINGQLVGRVNDGYTTQEKVATISSNSSGNISNNSQSYLASFWQNGNKLSSELKSQLFTERVTPEQQEAYKVKAATTISSTVSSIISNTQTTSDDLHNQNMDDLKPMTDLYISCYIYHDLNEESIIADNQYTQICDMIVNQIRAGKLDKDYAQTQMEKASNSLIHAKSIGQVTLDSNCQTIQNQIREKLNRQMVSTLEEEEYKEYVRNVLIEANNAAKFSSDTVVDTYVPEVDRILEELRSILV